MAITKEQLLSLGFKPSKRGGGLSTKKYDTLIYPINDTDFLYIGYNQFNKKVNNKVIWKSFKGEDGRITYPVISLGDTGYFELKDFIKRVDISVQNYATTTLSDTEIWEQTTGELSNNIEVDNSGVETVIPEY